MQTAKDLTDAEKAEQLRTIGRMKVTTAPKQAAPEFNRKARRRLAKLAEAYGR